MPEFFRKDLTKKDLAAMIRGTAPSYQAWEIAEKLLPKIKKFWDYTGGFVDEFKPKDYDGKEESFEELNMMYHFLEQFK